MINLHVAARHSTTWPLFLAGADEGTHIALDGYVVGPPATRLSRTPDRTWRLVCNFDHHSGVDRLATRSTCAQVHIALKQGLGMWLRPEADVYVNDCDQDTALAVWMLRNPDRFLSNASEPLLNRLIWAEDMMDATGGAYPLNPHSELAQQLFWIFDPYQAARANGSIATMSDDGMRTVIDAVGHRISAYLIGKAEQMSPSGDWSMLDSFPEWALVREVGKHARTMMYSQGVRAFVSVQDMPDGKRLYKIGKMSPYVNFPLDWLYVALTLAEQEAQGVDRLPGGDWGGSDIIGGGPRDGSMLSPKQVTDVINQVLADAEKR